MNRMEGERGNPHPGPLPGGEGDWIPASGNDESEVNPAIRPGR